MSKKKRSPKSRVNNSRVNQPKRSNKEAKRSRSVSILRFLLNQLVSVILKSIIDKPVKDLLSWVWALIIG